MDPTREVTVPPEDFEAQTITVAPGQAHLGDLRSASGLGVGDGLLTHTSKWLQARPCRPALAAPLPHSKLRASSLCASAMLLPQARAHSYATKTCGFTE